MRLWFHKYIINIERLDRARSKNLLVIHVVYIIFVKYLAIYCNFEF